MKRQQIAFGNPPLSLRNLITKPINGKDYGNQPNSNDSNSVSNGLTTLRTYLRIKPLQIDTQLLSNRSSSSETALSILIPISSTEVTLLPHLYPAKVDHNLQPINQNTSVYDRTYQHSNLPPFNYDKLFPPETYTHSVFKETFFPLLNRFVQGFNSAVLIYGMTGAGKTHTMFGGENNKNGGNEGIVHMAVEWLTKQSSVTVTHPSSEKWYLKLSFYYIYNEVVRDLLGEGTNLQVMEDSSKGVFVQGLFEASVTDCSAATQLIKYGLKRRARNATLLNESSSRSHALLQFTLRRHCQKYSSNEWSVSESKLFLIDLAGNYRASNNEAQRFTEGVSINKSLLVLGKCLTMLAYPKRNQFIAYRDSKLTRVLKYALAGNSYTVLISCVSAYPQFYEETLNTLKYSALARKVKTCPLKATSQTLTNREVEASHFLAHYSHLYQNVRQQTKNHYLLKGATEKIMPILQTAQYSTQAYKLVSEPTLANFDNMQSIFGLLRQQAIGYCLLRYIEDTIAEGQMIRLQDPLLIQQHPSSHLNTLKQLEGKKECVMKRLQRISYELRKLMGVAQSKQVAMKPLLKPTEVFQTSNCNSIKADSSFERYSFNKAAPTNAISMRSYVSMTPKQHYSNKYNYGPNHSGLRRKPTTLCKYKTLTIDTAQYDRGHASSKYNTMESSTRGNLFIQELSNSQSLQKLSSKPANSMRKLSPRTSFGPKSQMHSPSDGYRLHTASTSLSLAMYQSYGKSMANQLSMTANKTGRKTTLGCEGYR